MRGKLHQDRYAERVAAKMVVLNSGSTLYSCRPDLGRDKIFSALKEDFESEVL